MVALDILSDGFFAAIAGIGFGAISDPPLRAFKMIAILAALTCVPFLSDDLLGCRYCYGFFIRWISNRVRQLMAWKAGILPDDGAVYSRIAPDDSGKICVQHGILSYYVLADSE